MTKPPDSGLESRLLAHHNVLQQPGLAAVEGKMRYLVLAAPSLSRHGDDATLHGLAARRAGASWAGIEALGALVECHGGLPTCGSGVQILRPVRHDEQQTTVESSVVAYA